MAAVILVAGQKGGCSKSTLARAIAVTLAQNGQRVAIVDWDTMQRTTTDWAETRRVNGLKPFIEVRSSMGPEWERVGERQRPGVIVYDTPGATDAETLRLAREANLIVLPTAPSDDDLRPLVRLYNDMIANGIAPERVCVVITNVLTAPEFLRASERLTHEAGIPTAPHALRAQASYRTAMSGGLSIVEVSAPSLRAEAQAVVDDILRRVPAALQKTGAETKGLDLSWL